MSVTKNQKGGVITDTVITLPLFLLLVFVFISLIYASYLALALQYVAKYGVRELVVGPASSGGTLASHALNTRTKIYNKALGMGVYLNINDITICPTTLPNCNMVMSFIPNQLVIVKIDYSRNIYKNYFSLQGIGIGRNEPQSS